MTEMVVISKLAEDVSPIMKEFIEELGYTKEQAEKFVEGYIERAMTYPITHKMLALTDMDGSCMTSGFERAGIDEDEAFERAKEIL